MSRVITLAVAAHKGGVGKTTTTRNLAHTLAERGLRVLCIDADPQGSLGRAFGVDGIAHGLADVIGGERPGTMLLADALQLIPPLRLCLAGVQLGDYEIAAMNRLGRENMIKRALATVKNDFDVCLIDCPPARALLTINALNASQGVLMLTKAGALEAAALMEFVGTIEAVRAELNPALDTVGVVFNEYTNQGTYDAEHLEAMKEAGFHIAGVIGRAVAIKRATQAGLALAQFELSNPRVNDYERLTDEVMQWLNK